MEAALNPPKIDCGRSGKKHLYEHLSCFSGVWGGVGLRTWLMNYAAQFLLF